MGGAAHLGGQLCLIPWLSLRKEDDYGDTRLHPLFRSSIGFDQVPSIGIIGAFIGAWLLPQLGIRIGAIVSATIGAVVLLLTLRVVRRGGRW